MVFAKNSANIAIFASCTKY